MNLVCFVAWQMQVRSRSSIGLGRHCGELLWGLLCCSPGQVYAFVTLSAKLGWKLKDVDIAPLVSKIGGGSPNPNTIRLALLFARAPFKG